MAMEDRPDQEEESRALSPIDSQEIAPVEVKEPDVPKGITEKEEEELRIRSTELVKKLEEASGSQEMELVDSITSLGLQAQRSAAADLELLRPRVGDMLSKGGTGEKITKDLVDMRLALNQINPHELSEKGLLKRIVGKIAPFLKALEKIAIRYEAVSKQVTIIETRLREGRRMLTKDNVELRKLYEQVEAKQLPIQRNAYLGELIMQQLDGLLKNTDDPLRSERIRNALYDVSVRVQDLRVTEEVHIQFFVSIEMTRQNNTRLGQAVERTLTLATNVVTVGLAIQTALSRQKRILEATKRTQEFLGNLIVANAATIKQHTQDIGDVYKDPVIAIEKITQAHNDLMEAMDIADRLKQEGIDVARQNIARLSQLSTELQERSTGLRERRETEPKSIEA